MTLALAMAECGVVAGIAAEREARAHAAATRDGRRAAWSRITVAATSARRSSRPTLTSTRSASAFVGSTYRDFVAYGGLVLVLLFRPSGLFGEEVRVV